MSRQEEENRLSKYDLEELRVRLSCCKKPSQFKVLMEQYPQLKGRSMAEVRALVDTNTDILKGRKTGETRRSRLQRARRYGWGKK